MNSGSWILILLFIVFFLMADYVLVGFAICDYELILSRARGLDCGIVPPGWGFPSARNLKCSHWPIGPSFCQLVSPVGNVNLNPSLHDIQAVVLDS